MDAREPGTTGSEEQNEALISLSLADFLRELWPKLWFTLEDGVSVHDSHGRFLLVNPAYCRLVGRTEEQLVGQSFLTLVPADLRAEYREKYLRAAATGRSGSIGEFQLQHSSGRRLYVTARNTFLEVSGQKLQAFITRDISELRALELQVMHSERVRALGTLAGGVAHEFNNLLVSILGYAELIGDLDTGEKVKSFARKIRRAARRGTQITGQLLPFSRKEQSQREPVDLHEVLGEAVQLFQLSSPGGIEVTMQLAADDCRVQASAIQLHQMFLNILINARDAMPEGGELRVETSTVPPPANGDLPSMDIRISDTGSGMEDEVRRRIFEPFFTTKPSGEGTGLGMALVFSTATGHGGTVSVDSAAGQGTTVTVRLPRIGRRH